MVQRSQKRRLKNHRHKSKLRPDTLFHEDIPHRNLRFLPCHPRVVPYAIS
jgi:hypothetical protein